QRVLLAKGFLERRQVAVRGEALDGLQLVAVELRGEHEARADGGAVEADGASAADAVLAADVRAGQAERVADVVREQEPRLDGLAPAAAVDDELDLDHPDPSSAFRHARTSARSARTPV